MFFLIAFSASAVVAAGKIETGRISGTVTVEGTGPVADGMVLFFSKAAGPPPDINKYMRTPEHVADTDSKGEFSTVLPAGTYYIGVTKRRTDKWGGPPREEDVFFISMDEGGARAYVVSKDGHTDAGTISEIKQEEAAAVEGITAIEGTMYDMNGNRLEDMVVFGYAESTMDKGPSFVSGYTGEDGGYVLRVHKGGTYYFMVMGKFGSLFPGAGMTVLEQGKEVSSGITVGTGEIMKGVDIKVALPSETLLK